MPYMYALHACLLRCVCLICMPYVSASYVCLICMPYVSSAYACLRCMPHMYALYVCLMCMPYMYAYCEVFKEQAWATETVGNLNPKP